MKLLLKYLMYYELFISFNKKKEENPSKSSSYIIKEKFFFYQKQRKGFKYNKAELIASL